jgi:hypothetical protein
VAEGRGLKEKGWKLEFSPLSLKKFSRTYPTGENPPDPRTSPIGGEVEDLKGNSGPPTFGA